jgi:O-methyltransferase
LKGLAKRLLARLGFDLRRLPAPEIRDAARRAGISYELIRPNATHAPWRDNGPFQQTLAAIRDYTLVDEYRLYELWSLVAQTRHLDGDVLEVGVWRGGSGAVLARSALVTRSASRVYLCDTFAGVVKASSRDSTYRGGEHAASRDDVDALIRSLGLTNVRVLEGVFPEETGPAIADTRIRLCHIDVDVYESARGVLRWVWDRLAIGGVVVFDDYGFPQCDGVIRLVDEESTLPGRVVVYNLNAHAVMIKTGG